MKIFNKIMLVVFIFSSTGSTALGMGEYSDLSQKVKMETDACLSSFIEFLKPSFVIADNPPIKISATELKNLRNAAVWGDINKVKELMNAIAPDQRVAAALSIDEHDMTLLNAAFCGFCPATVSIILDFIPQDQRCGVVMFRAQNGETILHKIVQGFAVCNVYELGKLLQVIPVRQRINFILAFDRIGCTVFDYLVKPSLRTPLDVIVNVIKVLLISIPRELQADVIMRMNRSGNTPLHSAVLACQLFPAEEPCVLHIMRAFLDTVPEERRVGVIMAKNFYGESVLQQALRCRLSKVLALFGEYCVASMARTHNLLKKTREEPK